MYVLGRPAEQLSASEISYASPFTSLHPCILILKWLNLLLSTFDPGFDKVGPPFPTDSSHFVEISIWGIGYSRVQVEFHGTNHISHMLVDVEMAKTFQQFLHWNPEICCRGIISASSQKVVYQAGSTESSRLMGKEASSVLYSTLSVWNKHQIRVSNEVESTNISPFTHQWFEHHFLWSSQPSLAISNATFHNSGMAGVASMVTGYEWD